MCCVGHNMPTFTCASKALLRLASSYKTQPKAHMSLFWLYVRLVKDNKYKYI